MQPHAKKVGILGGKGMLGQDLVAFLGTRYKTEAIDKDNYESLKGARYDVLVNANGNSKRFWANEHPLDDFHASTVSVYQSIADFSFETYIYLSSSDVYEDHTSPLSTKEEQEINPRNLSAYGFHKYLAEQIVMRAAKQYLILRSSMILGANLRKGPFYDMLEGKPLFIGLDSTLQLITTEAIADIIHQLLNRKIIKETFNMGGKGAFPIASAQPFFKHAFTVSPEAETQRYEMSVEKLQGHYPLKSSQEYGETFLRTRLKSSMRKR